MKLSIDEFVELFLYLLEVVVESCDLLGAQLEAGGLVAAAVQSLQGHQDYWAVGLGGLAGQLHIYSPIQRY